MVTPILTMPTAPLAQSSTFSLEDNDQVHESPYSRQRQTWAFPGQRWRARYALPPGRRDRLAAWQGFLAALGGRSGRFYAWDMDAPSPRGTALGVPVVDGNGQLGKKLATKGWTADQAQALRAGDFVGLGGYADGWSSLHMVVADAAADATGKASLQLTPAIYTAAADGTPLVLERPACVMQLVDPRIGWDGDQTGVLSIAFEAVQQVTPT